MHLKRICITNRNFSFSERFHFGWISMMFFYAAKNNARRFNNGYKAVWKKYALMYACLVLWFGSEPNLLCNSTKFALWIVNAQKVDDDNLKIGGPFNNSFHSKLNYWFNEIWFLIIRISVLFYYRSDHALQMFFYGNNCYEFEACN